MKRAGFQGASTPLSTGPTTQSVTATDRFRVEVGPAETASSRSSGDRAGFGVGGFGLDGPAVRAMFTAARALADPERMARVRPDLPLYVAVGSEDPVNGQLALAHALVDRYRAAGLSDITFHAYPGARHEVFNETNRDEVERDLLAWLDRVVPTGRTA